MRKIFCVIVVLSLSLSGCFLKKVHNKLFHADCRKPIHELSDIIIDIKTDNLFIVEAGLEENYKEHLNGTIYNNVERILRSDLKQEIEKKHFIATMNKKCDSHSVIVEGNVRYIKMYYDRGILPTSRGRLKYEGKMDARIIECSTKHAVHSKKIDSHADDLLTMAEDFGTELGDFAVDKLDSCMSSGQH